MTRKVSTRHLAVELTAITDAAALASFRWLGKGRKKMGDGAAVDAMRKGFMHMDIDGLVVIGEGEKDEAPMLYNGERVGNGNGPQVDVAVDPVEGTRLLALGKPNSIAVVALAPRGSMFNPGPAFYMNKLVVPAQARGKVNIHDPVARTLSTVAQCLNKSVEELTVFVLDKERHTKLINDIRDVGARIQLHTDGDVAGALMAVMPGTGVDVMMGTGGTPEGVLAAAAVRVLGGEMQGLLDPQSDAEERAVREAGFDLARVLRTEDLVASNDILFAATGITDGVFLAGVTPTPSGIKTSSMVMTGASGTVRRIESVYTPLRHSQLEVQAFA
ncbi:MAG: class II fructose-bisphosphatase [Humidesulfovibrio sp.]|uniref:class II fructose-bisphosphatase n=1 Tax=Humidesulfovibrio sp. TaxID=2910988 RepID=UPI0027F5258C|nr:class II fructose-bisphosphatase [Humidesulfovibrio sp.]MDQ7835650.1 class II fructose-bisphosphatase [Humidesulfovibrio sp.]